MNFKENDGNMHSIQKNQLPSVIKLVFFGSSGVGKTTLLHRFCNGVFLNNTRLTIGLEFFSRNINIDNTSIYLQIWDFSGLERFRFLFKSYFNGSGGGAFIYDVSNPITIESMPSWMEVLNHKAGGIPIVILGNKIDLLNNKIESKPKIIDEYSKTFNIVDFLFTSSKNGNNVCNLFNGVFDAIKSRSQYVFN